MSGREDWHNREMGRLSWALTLVLNTQLKHPVRQEQLWRPPRVIDDDAEAEMVDDDGFDDGPVADTYEAFQAQMRARDLAIREREWRASREAKTWSNILADVGGDEEDP